MLTGENANSTDQYHTSQVKFRIGAKSYVFITDCNSCRQKSTGFAGLMSKHNHLQFYVNDSLYSS
jgi:hypothetical protein